MEPSNEDFPKFQVGICMAGAVSAGAYTVGVMDYLLEALTAYEKVRGQPGFPKHKVEIPVMGGASAGGMTAVLAAAGLQQGITPINQPTNKLLADHPENILYHSWVDLPNIYDKPRLRRWHNFTQEVVLREVRSELVNSCPHFYRNLKYCICTCLPT